MADFTPGDARPHSEAAQAEAFLEIARAVQEKLK
jgi:hypothetical protein